MAPPVTRIILYVKDIPKVADFYQRHFALKPLPSAEKGWMELTDGKGGCNIALHQAAVTQKSGAAVKIVFGVADVRKFAREREKDGLKFGAISRHGRFPVCQREGSCRQFDIDFQSEPEIERHRVPN